MDKYGRGDWKSISRLSVQSRTPAQVASHAQKYFRQEDISDEDRKKLSVRDITILDDGKMVTQQMPESSMHDVTILDYGKMVTKQVPNSSICDGKMITQQVPTTEQVAGAADSFLIDTRFYPLSNTVGTDLCNSLIDSQCNLSTPQGPSSEGMIADANFDFFASLMMDNLLGICTPPSTQQNSDEAAGVRLCIPLFASQNNIPTSQELIAEQQIVLDDFDFCDSLFADEPDIPTTPGSMAEQVIETAEGACVLNFGDSSSQGHPDVGANAPSTASQPTPVPVLSDVALPGSFPSPSSYGFIFQMMQPFFLCNSPDNWLPRHVQYLHHTRADGSLWKYNIEMSCECRRKVIFVREIYQKGVSYRNAIIPLVIPPTNYIRQGFVLSI